MPQDATPPPLACSLNAGDLKQRMAWIAELNADALRGYQRDGQRLELTYEPSAAARVSEFVRREQECCPFLGFTIREQGGELVLVIEAPEDAAAVDVLFVGYTAHSGDATRSGRGRWLAP